MISVELRINGSLIAVAHAVNVTPESLTERAEYAVTYTSFDPDPLVAPITGKAKVVHMRDEGAAVLAQKILKVIK